jgi:outer membrane lipoprotein carrier protein
MNAFAHTLLGICGVLALAPAPVRAGDTPDEILGRVRKKYDSIRDAEVSFSQRTRFAVAKIEHQAHGTLALKKENKYRIEMEDQVIVTDGVTVWSYSVPNKQVLIDVFRQNERTLSPERILSGAPGEYAPTVIGHENIEGADMAILKLAPRGEHMLVASLRLWIDTETWLIRKAEVTDVNGKETTYSVSDIRINTGIPDARFTLKIPEGVEVVDLR